MKILNTSGTLGDTYINCCKLYGIKKSLTIYHFQIHPEFNNTIRKLYSLIPNIIELKIINKKRNSSNLKYPYFNSFPKKYPGD